MFIFRKGILLVSVAKGKNVTSSLTFAWMLSFTSSFFRVSSELYVSM